MGNGSTPRRAVATYVPASLAVVAVLALLAASRDGVTTRGVLLVAASIPVAVAVAVWLRRRDDGRAALPAPVAARSSERPAPSSRPATEAEAEPRAGGRRRVTREAVALWVACLPAVAALLFSALAPSDGANIGGGMALMASVPVGAVLFVLLRPRDAEGHPIHQGVTVGRRRRPDRPR